MLIESGIHLKTMLVAIYAKMFITLLFQQFTQTLNRFFYLKRTNEATLRIKALLRYFQFLHDCYLQ